jgi:HK97 family phage major capsid protein
MPVLEKADIQSWEKSRVEKELRARRDDVASLREKNGGTLVGIAGADAETVRDHMQSLNLLGERFDELREQESADGTITKLSEFLDEPAAHPGHPKANGRQQEAPQDIGGLFVQSEAWKAYNERGEKNRPVTVPFSSLFGSAFKGIGEVPNEQLRMQAALFDSTSFGTRRDYRDDALVSTLYQPNNIGSLMPQGTTDSDTVTYPVETVTATGAAEVAEGATKPEAQISFADVDEPIRTIAVLLPMTTKSLRNQAFLRAYINARLRLFVQMREDGQLLNGNGTAPNLKGILNRSGINTATSYSIAGANADQALIDAVFHAAMRVRDSFLEPDATVMKPSTWEIAALAKDANRNYLLGGPGTYAQDGPNPRLWGLKVVLNANMPAQAAANKDVLVGAFATSAMVVRRGGIELALSDSHSTFFAENKVMLRAEEEVGLLVFRPAGFAAVTSAA